jgi:phosphoheptose isomerase
LIRLGLSQSPETTAPIDAVITAIIGAYANDGKVLIFGNGGLRGGRAALCWRVSEPFCFDRPLP